MFHFPEIPMKLRSALFTVLLAAAATQASAQTGPIKVANGILVGDKGMTVYTFDKDTTGKSLCNGQCATNWPPVMADGAKLSGDYSTVTRDDGKMQVAYKGKPLYYWVKDAKAGDTTGDNVNNVWHVVKP
jgi:predicted lipoprotein with Yx(FWY)xxD motif